MLLVVSGGFDRWFEEGIVGQTTDDEGDDDGDGIAHGEAGEHHFGGVAKGFVGAEGGDGIKNGGGKHVCDGTRDGESVADKAGDDGDDGAFADGENGAEEAAEHDGEGFIAGKDFFEGTAWEVGPEKAADESAKENEWEPLDKDGEEFVRAV